MALSVVNSPYTKYAVSMIAVEQFVEGTICREILDEKEAPQTEMLQNL